MLLGVGFAATRELLDHLSGLRPDAAMDAAVTIIAAVRELVGDHVEHNAYFRDFPKGVPDTMAFWVDCVVDALAAGDRSAFGRGGVLNLLALPPLRPLPALLQEMAAGRDAFVASAKDRMTALHLGRSLDEEARALYLALAASTVPLGEADLRLLEVLAAWCVDGEQPDEIPVRENRALVNRVRLRTTGRCSSTRSPTCCGWRAPSRAATCRWPSRPGSGHCRARSARACWRRWTVVAAVPAKVVDVARHRERWKRLGERLHPHEYPELPHAQDVFAVARGDRTVRSLAGRVELALAAGDLPAPRSARCPSRRACCSAPSTACCARRPDAETDAVRRRAASRACCGSRVRPRAAARPARAPAQPRATPDAGPDLRQPGRRAWVTEDLRAPLDPAVVRRVDACWTTALARRLPALAAAGRRPGGAVARVAAVGPVDARRVRRAAARLVVPVDR